MLDTEDEMNVEAVELEATEENDEVDTEVEVTLVTGVDGVELVKIETTDVVANEEVDAADEVFTDQETREGRKMWE